jgi:hypothetical protein
MMRIFDAPNAHLALASSPWDCLSATRETGAVDRTKLVLSESHSVLLSGLGVMARFWIGRKQTDASDFEGAVTERGCRIGKGRDFNRLIRYSRVR